MVARLDVGLLDDVMDSTGGEEDSQSFLFQVNRVDLLASKAIDGLLVPGEHLIVQVLGGVVPVVVRLGAEVYTHWAGISSCLATVVQFHFVVNVHLLGLVTIKCFPIVEQTQSNFLSTHISH